MSRFMMLESELRDENGTVIRRPLELLVYMSEQHVGGKRLGRHLEHDPMSKLFSVPGVSDILDAGHEIQSAYWERHSPVFNQGEVGSCTGMAMACLLTTGLFGQAELLRGEEREGLELYSAASRLDRIPGEYPENDTGSSGLAVCKAAKEFGLIQAYHHAFTARAMLKAIQSGPLLSGFNWYESFDAPDENGIVRIVPGAVSRGGHEVCMYASRIAYNDDGTIDEDNTLLDFWNSWGPDFGRGGAFSMSLRTYRRLMREHGDTTVPIFHPVDISAEPTTADELPVEPESSEV